MFEAELINVLDSIDLERAESLSMRIHDAESNGYSVSDAEDSLWIELTDKITEHYPN